MSRILVVDDEPIIRMLLLESLADDGHTVAAAGNGAEALDRVLEQPADVILLDLLMPRMDGLTFLRERQGHPALANVPVVVLSAAGAAGLREASHLCATAVLSKPIDLDVLSALVDRVLHEWRPPIPAQLTALTARPVGTCPICARTVYAEAGPTLRDLHAARLGHVQTHTAAEMASVPLRQRLRCMPRRGRDTLATWLYHDLRRDWGDRDRRGVHSIEAVLDSPAVHRFWQDVAGCTCGDCRRA